MSCTILNNVSNHPTSVEATAQSKTPTWAESAQKSVLNHAAVNARKQSGSARAFIDSNWCAEWGTGGQTDITDLRIAQNPIDCEKPLEDAFMLNGGNYNPKIMANYNDKRVVVRNAHGDLCTLHQILLNPEEHLNANKGCWKVQNNNTNSEEVGLAWSVLFVKCPDNKDSVDIALHTMYYNATCTENPNKVWLVNYGSGPMIAAGATSGGYQRHMNRNKDGNPCYVKVRVCNIQASQRPDGLSSMSYENRQAAIEQKMTEGGDTITLIQVPIKPSNKRPLNSSYSDPYGLGSNDDAPVYRSFDSGMQAFTTELENGSNMEMDESHANLPHIQNPMHYVREGQIRAAGMPRIDMIKVIAVKGNVTDDIIQMASDWLQERNSGQLIPREEIAAIQIKQNVLLAIQKDADAVAKVA